MLIEQFMQTRAERLIALGRVLIAAFAIAAVWLDPEQPARAEAMTYGLLGAYLAAALAILTSSRPRRRWSAVSGLASHVLDLAILTLVILLTERPNSPFFLLFTFSLLSATFRWHWKGALWTSVSVAVLLLFIASASPLFAPGAVLDTERLVIRFGFLLVIGAMLVYFGFHQQRLANETVDLVSWQPDREALGDSQVFLEAGAKRVGEMFPGARVALVLQDPEEPAALACVWEDGLVRQDRLPADILDTGIDAALAGSAFMRDAAGNVIVVSRSGKLTPWLGVPIAHCLGSRYAMNEVLSVPIHGEAVSGRLFVMDCPQPSLEQLVLITILATQLSAGLERLQTVAALRRSAVAEERLLLARDLHDGALQTLAGTALQLEALANTVERAPATARARIGELQQWLVAEQRYFRDFIRKLRPGQATAIAGAGEPAAALTALAHRLQQQWNVSIILCDDVTELELPEEVEFPLLQILREAVANAVRHGGASEIRMDMTSIDDRLGVRLADNGRGLPVHGCFDEKQAAGRRIGPRGLRERVLGLGGTFELQSSPEGLALSISIPLREAIL
jgi:signal transduction histidine kinase